MTSSEFQTILGVRFFLGTAEEALERVCPQGGLVVVPSGPGMRTIGQDRVYSESLLGADLAITDSGFMVLIWNLTHRRKVPKLSGLKYLRALIERPDFRQQDATLWVMPNESAAERTINWLAAQGVSVSKDHIYIAPFYQGKAEDPALVALTEKLRPKHLIMGIGGGTQEPLGYYLKTQLKHMPAIHCIGAAIGFLTGDQVYIPVWVDAIGMGWLWRIFSNPRRFFPRYWEARYLARIMLHYGEHLPSR